MTTRCINSRSLSLSLSTNRLSARNSGGTRYVRLYQTDSSWARKHVYCCHRADATPTRSEYRIDRLRPSGSFSTHCRKHFARTHFLRKKRKGSPYSTAERRVPEPIPVLGSQPAGDVSHKPGGRRPLLSARPAVTLATLKGAATNFAA